MKLLSVQNLWVTYPQTESSHEGRHATEGKADAIEGVSFELAAGEVIGIVTESRGGKSTLSRAILGLLPAGAQIQGKILVEGQSAPDMDADAMRRLRGGIVGSILQDPMTRLDPLMTIGNHCLETLQAHEPTLTDRQAKRRAIVTLADLNIPEYRWHQYPHELSGLMRQRLAIAIALLPDPKLIIVEDLTQDLDVRLAMVILHELTRLCKERRIGLLSISADLAQIAAYCDRIVVMNRGHQEEVGSVEQTIARPQSKYTQKLVRAVLPPQTKNMPTEWLWQPANERQPTAATATLTPKKPILTLDRLHKHYTIAPSLIERLFTTATPQIDRVIANIQLELYEGEILGLVGASGCGKTTLLRTILQLIPATGGTVTYCGEELTHLPPDAIRIVCRHLQAIFQDPSASLNPVMTIGQNVADPLVIHERDDNPATTRSQVLVMLERVGLNPAAKYFDLYPNQLSNVENLRVCIARATIVQPKLVIFDDSMSMLDRADRAEILKLILELQRESNLTYLFLTRDIQLARCLCDRIAIMDRGQIVEMIHP
jgi:peptide/nickel transport system ATP-binding protein